MSYLAKVSELYDMIHAGQLLDAFEKYYHDDVVMIEATGEKREGKETNRKAEEEFLGKIETFHDAGVSAMTSNEELGITMVESWMKVTFKEQGKIKMEQVAVQHWRGDQIIQERFYYNPGAME